MDPRSLSFSEKTLIARTRLGENQEAFGNRLGVTRFAVAGWEDGTTKPQTEARSKLKQLFVEMFGDEEDAMYESVAYQLFLPFDDPVKVEFRIMPQSEKGVRLGVEAKRRKVV
jgi:DNA-binding XRE family transcriptional regulator